MLLKNSEAGAAEKEGRETPTGRIKNNTGFSLFWYRYCQSSIFCTVFARRSKNSCLKKPFNSRVGHALTFCFTPTPTQQCVLCLRGQRQRAEIQETSTANSGPQSRQCIRANAPTISMLRAKRLRLAIRRE